VEVKGVLKTGGIRKNKAFGGKSEGRRKTWEGTGRRGFQVVMRQRETMQNMIEA